MALINEYGAYFVGCVVGGFITRLWSDDTIWETMGVIGLGFIICILFGGFIKKLFKKDKPDDRYPLW